MRLERHYQATPLPLPPKSQERGEQMNNYAVDYGWQNATRIFGWQDGNGELTSLVLGAQKATREAELRAFLRQLSGEDTLWLELGGPNSRFTLAAGRQGATIWRIPTFRIAQLREAQGRNGDQDALVIHEASRNHPELFYPYAEPDEEVARLRVLVQARLKAQKAREQAAQRWTSAYLDLALLESDEVPTEEEMTALEKEIVARILNLPAIAEAIHQEGEFAAQIEEAVTAMDLYQRVFAPIIGCGPLLSAELIAGTLDIRRFATREHFVNDTIFGFYVVNGEPTGQPKLRVSGRTQGADQLLSQAVWKLVDWTRHYGRAGHQSKQMYLARLAREQEHHPELTVPHRRRRAMRWLAIKFLHLIYARWSSYLRGEQLTPTF